MTGQSPDPVGVSCPGSVRQVREPASTLTHHDGLIKDGALAALASSKPGNTVKERDYELEAAKAEVARLSEAVKKSRSGSPWPGEKAVGVEWPCPTPCRCGNQSWLLGLLNQTLAAG